jgi:putative DNA primase/helicase
MNAQPDIKNDPKIIDIQKTKPTNMPEGFSYTKRGLVYLDPNNDNANPLWICSKLEVTAQTCDTESNNWGRVVEFTDPAGKRKKWVMPMELLAGRGDQLHATLLNMGLKLNNQARARSLLAQFIQNAHTDKQAVCVTRVGWFEDCFILPTRTLGDAKGREILLQTPYPDSLGFSERGTLDAWRDNVAAYAKGNSRLSFAISAAFTAPLLSLTGIEGGGFHFRGGSSLGKTTALYMAASVWGGHDRKKMWRATTNGLEQTAYLHNDSLLCLDEMGEMNGRDIGAAVYMLANGQAKQRMTDTTKPKTWITLFVSTGELALKAAMLEAGTLTRAGQEVRLIDIEADTGAHGIFDVILDAESCSREQAEHLQQATREQHGTAGVTFLERFIASRSDSLQALEQSKTQFLTQYTPPNATNQVQRVLNRFATVAACGELATAYGLTGWNKGEAVQGAAACFKAWLNHMGDPSQTDEHRQALERVREFIERHSQSRFDNLAKAQNESPIIQNMAGYKRLEANGADSVMIYYFLPTVFKNEVCKGLDVSTVCTALKAAGVLKHDTGRNTAKSPVIEGGRRFNAYCIDSTILTLD